MCTCIWRLFSYHIYISRLQTRGPLASDPESYLDETETPSRNEVAHRSGYLGPRVPMCRRPLSSEFSVAVQRSAWRLGRSPGPKSETTAAMRLQASFSLSLVFCIRVWRMQGLNQMIPKSLSSVMVHDSVTLWPAGAKVLILVITGNQKELAKHFSLYQTLLLYWAPTARLTIPTQDDDKCKRLADHLDGAQEESARKASFASSIPLRADTPALGKIMNGTQRQKTWVQNAGGGARGQS